MDATTSPVTSRQKKIGLGIILGLLVILAAAIVLRLTMAKDNPLSSIGGTQNEIDKETSVAEALKRAPLLPPADNPLAGSPNPRTNNTAPWTSNPEKPRKDTAVIPAAATSGQNEVVPFAPVPKPARETPSVTVPKLPHHGPGHLPPHTLRPSPESAPGPSLGPSFGSPPPPAPVLAGNPLVAPSTPASAPPPAAPSRLSIPAEPAQAAPMPAPPGPSPGQFNEPTRTPASEPPSGYRHPGGRYGHAEPALSPAAGAWGGSPPHRVSEENLRRPDGSYQVQPNDNFWKISEKLYGSGAYFKALAEHNRNRHPQEDRLLPGALIAAPTVAELERSYPDLCPKAEHRRTAAMSGRSPVVGASAVSGGRRLYVVQQGDTLVDIAKHELGKQARWGEIYELNRDRLGNDFDYLVPGTQLVLPAKDPGVILSSRPGEGRYR